MNIYLKKLYSDIKQYGKMINNVEYVKNSNTFRILTYRYNDTLHNVRLKNGRVIMITSRCIKK